MISYQQLRRTWDREEHKVKKWFWRVNYPFVTIAFFAGVPERWLLFYTLICSVYANEETSAGADEAQKAKENSVSK